MKCVRELSGRCGGELSETGQEAVNKIRQERTMATGMGRNGKGLLQNMESP